MDMNKPVNVTLDLALSVLDERAGELEFCAIETLSGKLHANPFTAAAVREPLDYIADLGVEVRFENWDIVEERVKVSKGVAARAEQILE